MKFEKIRGIVAVVTILTIVLCVYFNNKNEQSKKEEERKTFTIDSIRNVKFFDSMKVVKTHQDSIYHDSKNYKDSINLNSSRVIDSLAKLAFDAELDVNDTHEARVNEAYYHNSFIAAQSGYDDSSVFEYANERLELSNIKLICKEYMLSTIDSDEKYKDKHIKIEGTIKNIRKTIFGDYVIELSGDENMRFYLNKRYEDQWVKLNKNNRIKLFGVCKGVYLNKVFVVGCYQHYHD